MPTYSKETALFDTGKIGDDINDAAGQVNKYITQIGDTGIKVHPYDSTNEQIDTDNYTKIDANGMEVYQESTKVASFGANGAQIGRTGAAHSVIDADGQRVYASNGTTQIANLGYGQGYNTQGQLVDAPFYTLGTRSSGSAVGNYSTAEGYNTIASRSYAHAEGDATHAVEHAAHAEGAATTASGKVSHAEGVNTTASGDYSHAEGYDAIAAGDYSHAQNHSTEAGYEAQTAIGKYNDNKSANAFEIGNGTSSASSNALEVTWTGDLTAAGEITDGTGNVLSDKIDASALADYVISQGTSGDWRYRKWHSGKIEAWFEGTFSCAASTTARGALYYSTWSLTIPNNAIGFTATPNTLIGNTGDSNTVIAVNGAATSTTAISGKVWRYASSSSALTISARIYAWQN